MPESLFSDSWYRVKDLTPSLRSNAEVARHRYRGELWYVLRDRSSGRVHRLSPAAYAVIRLMDGSRDLETIWQAASDEIGDDAPTQDELIQLMSQLHVSDVLVCDVPPDVVELFERGERVESQRFKRRIASPLAIQIPLFDPERFLTRTLPIFEPLLGVAGALLWLAVVLPAPVLVALHWPELTHNFLDRVFTPQNLVALWLVFPALKILHEFGHGYAAKAQGCEIHDMGLMLLVFTPVPYVDASSSWSLPSKFRRAAVGAGGVLVELFIASLALYVWLAAEPGIVRATAYNVLMIGGLTTLLFNGNPLLRFDGYYVLSDLIEIPNLRSRANRYVAFLSERYLLGNRDAVEPHVAPGEPAWFVGYAVAAFVYRLFVVAAILVFVLDWNFVLGVGLSSFALIGWFGIPLYKIVRHLISSPSLARTRVRAIAIAIVAVSGVTIAITAVPLPLRTRAEAVVWLPQQAFVRAETAGFVERLVSLPDAIVEPGDALLQLDDPELRAQIAFHEASVRELEAQYDAVKDEDRVEARIVQEKLVFARKELHRVQERETGLTIRSHVRGRFVVPRAEDLPDRFVQKGQLLAYVVDLDAITVRAVVDQDDIDLVRQRTERASVKLAEAVDATYPAAIRRIVPGASETLPSVALGSGAGGEVIVDPSDERGARAVESLFEVELALDDVPDSVHAGGRVYVRFDHGSEPLASQWYRRVRQLFLSRFDV